MEQNHLYGEKTVNDFLKARDIWNQSDTELEKKLSALKELAERTEDDIVKRQIGERLEVEQKKKELFFDNQDRMFVYMVDDGKQRFDFSCFGVGEMAIGYAAEYSKEHDVESCVKKRKVVWDEEGMEIKSSIILRACYNYYNEVTARVSLNKNGEIMYICSEELCEEDADKADELRKDRFEYGMNHLIAMIHAKGGGLPSFL